jgi:steroid delta-isomerase-like uncharacterized protein
MGDVMSADNARAAVEAIDAWSEDARERHRSYFTDDAVLHEHATGREVHGGDAIADVHWGWRQAFPDGRGTVGTVVDGGDQVAVEVVWSGTHQGPLMTPDGGSIPATGRTFSVPATMVLAMSDGKIERMAHYFDLMTLLTALGAMPAAQPA